MLNRVERFFFPFPILFQFLRFLLFVLNETGEMTTEKFPVWVFAGSEEFGDNVQFAFPPNVIMSDHKQILHPEQHLDLIGRDSAKVPRLCKSILPCTDITRQPM